MMDGLSATYAMFYQALHTSFVWGTRCYADFVPAGVRRPYCVYYRVAGGAARYNRPDVANVHQYQITVMCATEQPAQALDGANWIYRLHNSGTGNPGNVALQDYQGWRAINCVAMGDRIHVIDNVGSTQIYFDGYEFEITLQGLTDNG